MITKVTEVWLESHKACPVGFEYWIEQNKPDLFDFIAQCIKDDHCDWANWLMVMCMDRKQYMRYALYAIRKAAPMYHTRFPTSTIVTDVIKAIRACIRDDSKENRAAAGVVAEAAYNVVHRDANFVCYAVSDAAAYSAYAIYDVSSYISANDYVFYAVYSVANAISYNLASSRTAVFNNNIMYGVRIMKEKQK